MGTQIIQFKKMLKRIVIQGKVFITTGMIGRLFPLFWLLDIIYAFYQLIFFRQQLHYYSIWNTKQFQRIMIQSPFYEIV